MRIYSASALFTLATLLLSTCIHNQPDARVPTAHIAYVIQPTLAVSLPLLSTSTTLPPIETTATPYPPSSLTPLDQYRLWMEKARVQYPYDESVDTMWAVMLCESSGDPNNTADIYYGLFQYSSETWTGDWNPYREQPILDPQAQIFATAKAWHEGHQSWWGCYHM